MSQFQETQIELLQKLREHAHQSELLWEIAFGSRLQLPDPIVLRRVGAEAAASKLNQAYLLIRQAYGLLDAGSHEPKSIKEKEIND